MPPGPARWQPRAARRDRGPGSCAREDRTARLPTLLLPPRAVPKSPDRRSGPRATRGPPCRDGDARGRPRPPEPRASCCARTAAAGRGRSGWTMWRATRITSTARSLSAGRPQRGLRKRGKCSSASLGGGGEHGRIVIGSKRLDQPGQRTGRGTLANRATAVRRTRTLGSPRARARHGEQLLGVEQIADRGQGGGADLRAGILAHDPKQSAPALLTLEGAEAADQANPFARIEHAPHPLRQRRLSLPVIRRTKGAKLQVAWPPTAGGRAAGIGHRASAAPAAAPAPPPGPASLSPGPRCSGGRTPRRERGRGSHIGRFGPSARRNERAPLPPAPAAVQWRARPARAPAGRDRPPATGPGLPRVAVPRPCPQASIALARTTSSGSRRPRFTAAAASSRSLPDRPTRSSASMAAALTAGR